MTIEKAKAVLGIKASDTPEQMRIRATQVVKALHSDMKKSQERDIDLDFQFNEAKAAHDLLKEQVWGRRS